MHATRRVKTVRFTVRSAAPCAEVAPVGSTLFYLKPRLTTFVTANSRGPAWETSGSSLYDRCLGNRPRVTARSSPCLLLLRWFIYRDYRSPSVR